MGEYIWYELLTTDVAAAQRFYGHVVGLGCQDSGMPGQEYRIWSVGEVLVGGLMALPPGALQAGQRPGWLGYIHVADVDATVAAVAAEGGRVFMPGTDIPGIGRFALLSDPQGAAFYVMAPNGEGESAAFSHDKPGRVGWNELHTTDGAAALAFYSRHFGWRHTSDMDMGPMGKYIMFDLGTDGAAGGMANNGGAHPSWLYYFNVANIDAAMARVPEAGGTVTRGPQEVPGGMFIVHAADPQGAPFALVGKKG